MRRRHVSNLDTIVDWRSRVDSAAGSEVSMGGVMVTANDRFLEWTNAALLGFVEYKEFCMITTFPFDTSWTLTERQSVCACPLYHLPTLTGTWTANNWIAGDFSVDGVTGNPGNLTYFDAINTPAEILGGAAGVVGSVWWMDFDNIAPAGAPAYIDFGASSSATILWNHTSHLIDTNDLRISRWFDALGARVADAADEPALYMAHIDDTGGPAQTLFQRQAGSGAAQIATAAQSGTAPTTQDVYVFATNSSGAVIQHTGKTLSGMAWSRDNFYVSATADTTGAIDRWFEAWQYLRGALGGGVIA